MSNTLDNENGSRGAVGKKVRAQATATQQPRKVGKAVYSVGRLKIVDSNHRQLISKLVSWPLKGVVGPRSKDVLHSMDRLTMMVLMIRWFSGLRAKISQINMPEWLSQLGIGSSGDVAAAATVETLHDNDARGKSVPKNDETQQVQNSVSDESGGKSATTHEGDTVVTWPWDETDCGDTLALQHFGPLKNLITGCNRPGKGHNFLSISVAHPTWCDKCGDFMWGFLTRAVRCNNCNYTCHSQCRSLVTLDCKTVDSTLNSHHELLVTSSYPSLKVLVENDGNLAKEQKDETIGFVQIHMNFLRPINVVAGDSLSFLDVTNESGSLTVNSLRTITTFFLPRNTVKNVTISIKMTTREMIVILLRKFRVADNPRKFALYERSLDSSEDLAPQNKLTRIPDESFPLKIVRSWEEKGEKRQLVLQENDTGDILWDMFEVPELENFLKILEDEEKQYSFQIRRKYDAYRDVWYLDENLRNRGLAVNSNEFSPVKANSCLTTDL